MKKIIISILIIIILVFFYGFYCIISDDYRLGKIALYFNNDELAYNYFSKVNIKNDNYEESLRLYKELGKKVLTKIIIGEWENENSSYKYFVDKTFCCYSGNSITGATVGCGKWHIDDKNKIITIWDDGQFCHEFEYKKENVSFDGKTIKERDYIYANTEFGKIKFWKL